MKKNYNAPVAEKVDFDYEENVVASGAQTNVPVCHCPCKYDPQPVVEPSYYWFFPWCW